MDYKNYNFFSKNLTLIPKKLIQNYNLKLSDRAIYQSRLIIIEK
jgi:predicted nuclease of restriction endonuclease-like RecB superfamily